MVSIHCMAKEELRNQNQFKEFSQKEERKELQEGCQVHLKKKKNLILVGGPKVNTFVEEINSVLPIKFDEKNFVVKSSATGKTYEENVGVIELIKNPYNSDSKILLIGGLNQHGTKAAIIALAKKSSKLKADKSEVFAKVVQGYDENGDGIVDSVDIIE